jgi:peptidoglycan/LPS O-acetylase OafA/YrhL
LLSGRTVITSNADEAEKCRHGSSSCGMVVCGVATAAGRGGLRHRCLRCPEAGAGAARWLLDEIGVSVLSAPAPAVVVVGVALVATAHDQGRHTPLVVWAVILLAAALAVAAVQPQRAPSATGS